MRRNTQRVVSTLILLVAGGAFVALAATAMLTDHDVLAGAFGLLALLGFSLAALAPRIQGEVKASLNGFSFELIREVVDAGDRGGNPDEVVLAAIRKAIREASPTATTGPDLDLEEEAGEEDDDIYRDDQSQRPGGTAKLADALLQQARHALVTRPTSPTSQ